jgi:hypothetical protein
MSQEKIYNINIVIDVDVFTRSIEINIKNKQKFIEIREMMLFIGT